MVTVNGEEKNAAGKTIYAYLLEEGYDTSRVVVEQNLTIIPQEILRYINEHLTERLTLEELADKFYMSKNHLTAIFKRAAGTTVARYILYKRMTIARKELAEGTPAAEAAIKAGFGDYSSFFRAYRKMFGCAPSDQQAMELPDMDKSGDF